MKIKNIILTPIKLFFAPRQWLSYDSLAQNTRNIFNLAAASLRGVPRKQAKGNSLASFADEMERMGITEADLPIIARRYQLYSLMYVVLLLLDAGYAVYLWFIVHAIHAAIITTALLALLLAKALKYCLWHIQIKRRDLEYNINSLLNYWFK